MLFEKFFSEHNNHPKSDQSFWKFKEIRNLISSQSSQGKYQKLSEASNGDKKPSEQITLDVDTYLESGPSRVGETVCREMKFSGIFMSAGRESLLLISSWLESFLPPGFWRSLTRDVWFETEPETELERSSEPGDTLGSSEVPDPSSDSPSEPILGCSWTTPEM